MRTLEHYRIIKDKIDTEPHALKGRFIYYHCLKCGDFVPSQTEQSVQCKCANITIDADYVRLRVENFSLFEMVQELSG